ncbi:hypothetical protein [Streptomyces sp. NPDC002205]|uniref:hypothetical protein n=1 Tax=Streptomyces sp. NPDC002205 TaxID=3154411 RepID=UPI003324402C
MYSIWSAYTFGVAISTVAGRLWMTGRSGDASHSSVRLLQVRRRAAGRDDTRDDTHDALVSAVVAGDAEPAGRAARAELETTPTRLRTA